MVTKYCHLLPPLTLFLKVGRFYPLMAQHYTLFFYKNTETHILPTLKNILIAQIVSDLEMFLFCFDEAEKMEKSEIFPQKRDFLASFWSKNVFFSQYWLWNQRSYINKNVEPIFPRNLRTCKKGSNLENLRTTEPKKYTGSYKKVCR